MMPPTIRAAAVKDAEKLTAISFASKRHWRYPESYLRIWERELTVSTEYIRKNDVWVYERKRELAAYYSIIRLTEDREFTAQSLHKGYWLDHMFVSPAFIGCGIGAQLYNHMCEIYGKRKAGEIRVLSDPNARGFYERMGARYIGEFPSTIPGRSTPLMIITL